MGAAILDASASPGAARLRPASLAPTALEGAASGAVADVPFGAGSALSACGAGAAFFFGAGAAGSVSEGGIRAASPSRRARRACRSAFCCAASARAFASSASSSSLSSLSSSSSSSSPSPSSSMTFFFFTGCPSALVFLFAPALAAPALRGDARPAALPLPALALPLPLLVRRCSLPPPLDDLLPVTISAPLTPAAGPAACVKGFGVSLRPSMNWKALPRGRWSASACNGCPSLGRKKRSEGNPSCDGTGETIAMRERSARKSMSARAMAATIRVCGPLGSRRSTAVRTFAHTSRSRSKLLTLLARQPLM